MIDLSKLEPSEAERIAYCGEFSGGFVYRAF